MTGPALHHEWAEQARRRHASAHATGNANNLSTVYNGDELGRWPAYRRTAF